MMEALTSATSGQDGPLISTDLNGVISPEEFKLGCIQIVETLNADEAHAALDRLVTDVLDRLGYSDGMEIFMKHVGTFHAAPAPDGRA